MKTYPGIDYGFRPASYWGESDPLRAILRNVKGSNRRAMIADYWRAGMLERLDPVLLQDTLSHEERRRLGRIHPSFMGGEYLPGDLCGEVEIARIELRSVLSDVISIRARPLGRRIAYRVVDEYPEDWHYVPAQRTSRRPLTLAGLIRFIDHSCMVSESGEDLDLGGLALTANNRNAEGSGSRKEYRDFTRVSSPFHPDLGRHYEHVYEEWVREEAAAGEDE